MAEPVGFFVTGSDTDVGKTHVSRLLVDSFSAIRSTTYQKPVQTGCSRAADGTLLAPDFLAVEGGTMIHTGAVNDHVPYRFEPACAPHLAAHRAGTAISLDHIRDCFTRLSAAAELVVVEGAGGLLAPLGETTFMIDLIVHLNLPVVLVTSLRLGTINHTLLTLRVLHESGIRIAGIVGNETTPDIPDYIARDNARIIRGHTRPVPFLELPYGSADTRRIEEFRDDIIRQF
jgi:dethiobiotin synthetase